MKIAIVHDYLENKGGAEYVFETFTKLFPKAERYALFHKKRLFPSIKTNTSFIQRLPFKDYRKLLFLFPAAIESLRLPKDTEVILSSSHAFAKGVRKPKGALHICYCYTPMRYAWDMCEDYMKNEIIPGKFRLVLPFLITRLRAWDYKNAQNVDHFIAISKNIQSRIKKYYNRESTVIYPPVRTKFFKPARKKEEEFYLIVSRLVAIKRIDIVIDAFNVFRKKLIVIGDGREFHRLKAKAKTNIEFKGELSDEEVRNHYRRCKAFIFPSNDDFGITPVEAQACGKPVVAFGRGGALETVIEGKTGHFFYEQTPEALVKAIQESEKMKFDKKLCRKNALRFDEEIFRRKIKAFVAEKYRVHHAKKR